MTSRTLQEVYWETSALRSGTLALIISVTPNDIAMKKILFIIVTFCFLTTAHGQQFSFQMFFTDAIGNKDTLTIGYDINGTKFIDPSFGEKNIIGVPLAPIFDVRISDAFFSHGIATFHTKKQILPDSCTGWWFPVVSIDIKCKNWPVTATWDNLLFGTDCRKGSVFTSFNPGGWWDVGGFPSNLGRVELANKNQVTFTSNYNPSLDFNNNYAYINSSNETIPVFWMAFGNLSILHTSVDELSSSENVIKVFPNPASERISIQVPLQFGTVNGIEIFSSLGQLVLTTKKTSAINITQLVKGIYFVRVTNEKGDKLWTRTIKE